MPKQKLILKGIPASPGIAKGKVMKKGEILVTEMTDPLYMPAIRKAKAIVTDIGGLLSHAALLCRELKKPCCIGVRGATQILSDGMKINLNATKGIIRICED